PGITHLWMSYEVAQQDGAWPLPQLTEKRNLYWTQKTERRRAGQKRQDLGDIWYEAAIPADTPIAPQAHQATLASGYTVTATPMSASAAPELTNQRLAVVIDTSRSMGDRTADLTQAFEELAALAPSNTLDWYVTSEDGIPPAKLTQAPLAKELSFYGSLPLTDQLNQWAQLSPAAQYDAVFVLTDAGNYELETDEAMVPEFSSSLWLVHLDGQVPTAYTDALQQRLADSKGGVTSTIAAAVNRFAVEQQADATVMDGYRWAIAPASPTAAANTAAEFQALAARQTIRWLSRQQDVPQIEVLDQLHAIAKRTEIVTPYSSMLVLVNDRQREALKAAENDPDRFEREVEDGEDILTNPGDPLNASVPEPGTPLAILFIGSVMVWMVRRSKRHRLTPR
ncbi:MAG: TIGR02921 family PEP-CTERM protein, partial [Cyanobacteria bacterium P01_H01_bin.153]